jgi:hypothetical protein
MDEHERGMQLHPGTVTQKKAATISIEWDGVIVYWNVDQLGSE